MLGSLAPVFWFALKLLGWFILLVAVVLVFGWLERTADSFRRR